MNRPEEEIKWRSARRWKTKYERSQDADYRPLHVEDLTLKGWSAHARYNRKLTSQEASKLVLTGEGSRYNNTPLEVPEGTIVE
jgi:hypothetical protein